MQAGHISAPRRLRACRAIVLPNPGPVFAPNPVLLIECHFPFKQPHILLANPPEIFGMNLESTEHPSAAAWCFKQLERVDRREHKCRNRSFW
jgi:hypothetical protein